MQVEVDGKPLALPADIEGILLLNIPSYAGGVNLWASGAAAGSAVGRGGRAERLRRHAGGDSPALRVLRVLRRRCMPACRVSACDGLLKTTLVLQCASMKSDCCGPL